MAGYNFRVNLPRRVIPKAPGAFSSDVSVARLMLACLFVWVATIAAFAPVVANHLVNWDDTQTLVANDRYSGFGLDHLRWMFTTSFGGHYQPLSWLSFAVDTFMWGGVSPLGFHLTNVVLHLLTATALLGVALLLIRVAVPGGSASGRLLGATVASVLFAVHPLRVESVAWATERRDVLSGFFLVLTVLFYLRAQRSGSTRLDRGGLLASLVFYVLSLLSKASGVVLPVVLLLMDVYPLRRFPRRGSGDFWKSLRAILVEKLFYAIPAATVAALAVWAQLGSGALWSLAAHPLSLRIGQAFYGVLFYLGKTLWPVDLVPLYEQPTLATATNVEYVASFLGFVLITTVLVAQRRRWPALRCAWACYLAILAPVLGIFQSGPQLVADRYSYLSCMPWALVVGGWGAILWESKSRAGKSRRIELVAVFVAVTASLVMATRSQVRIWKDSRTLWTTAIARRPDTGLAHANLASVQLESGEFQKARKSAERAIAILPGNRLAHRILGQAALEEGRAGLAEKHLRRAMNLAGEEGKFDAAAAISLAELYVRQDRYDEAEEVYRGMVAANPGVADWHFLLGSFLGSRGRLEEARASFERAVRLHPAYADAYLRLGIVLRMTGEPADAIAALEKSVKLNPKDMHARVELAWMLATSKADALRDGKRALGLVESAMRDHAPVGVRTREVHAAALAESGAFAAAADSLRELLSDDRARLSEQKRDQLRSELQRYRQNLPVRE